LAVSFRNLIWSKEEVASVARGVCPGRKVQGNRTDAPRIDREEILGDAFDLYSTLGARPIVKLITPARVRSPFRPEPDSAPLNKVDAGSMRNDPAE